MVLRALHHTTHPSAFSSVRNVIDLGLRHYSHPNFIRWSICNGNQPRILLLRTLAVSWLSIAFILALLLVLSSVTRWARLAVIFPLWMGLVSITVSVQGLCVLLHRMHEREMRPWELDNPSNLTLNECYPSTETDKSKVGASLYPIFASTTGSTLATGAFDTKGFSTVDDDDDDDVDVDVHLESHLPAPQCTLELRLSPLGPPNDFLHEPWMTKWQEKSWWRNVAISKRRRIWVKEEALRVLQNRIVMQAEAWATIMTTVIMIGLVLCPKVGAL